MENSEIITLLSLSQDCSPFVAHSILIKAHLIKHISLFPRLAPARIGHFAVYFKWKCMHACDVNEHKTAAPTKGLLELTYINVIFTSY